MIPYRTRIDDVEYLRTLLASVDALLLDFDGPLCSVFAGTPAHFIATQLRNLVDTSQCTGLPPYIEKSDDPFEVFRYSASVSPELGQYIEAALRAHEAEAVMTAAPTRSADDVIHRWTASGRKISIVSNNSASAVITYLEIRNLAPEINYVSARRSYDPTLLKPSSFLVLRAIEELQARATRCAFVGDSSSDIVSGIRAGVKVIGYANKPEKVTTLAQSGAELVITDMRFIYDAIT